MASQWKGCRKAKLNAPRRGQLGETQLDYNPMGPIMQLFQPYHYSAFQPPKPTQDDPATVSERLLVRDALLRLDEMLWPTISRSGCDLHHHRQKSHYVSSDH